MVVTEAQWTNSHPWLHYSHADDGVYCKACDLFATDEVCGQKLGVLVSKPFRIWTSHSSTFSRHEKSITRIRFQPCEISNR